MTVLEDRASRATAAVLDGAGVRETKPLPGRDTPDRRCQRWPWVLASLVVAGVVLRFWALGANTLNFDETFTAMAGRRSLGGLFEYLRVRDSHPPLDYLLHLPFARIGASNFLFRLPSALCSAGALVLFAWWVRRRGLAGVVATGLMAFSAFQLLHGREARMYADMELIGVATAVLADSWLRRPRRWHAPAVGALVCVGLLTHVSMFLVGAGLLMLAGRRTDRDAWRWRAGLAAGAVGWAVLWGPSFLRQTRGGHSDWIPRTSLDRMVHTYGSLVTSSPQLHLLIVGVVVAGAVALWRTDRTLGRVWACCVLVPALLAALSGTVAPVLLDRTLTVIAWGPLLAIGFLVAAVAERSRLVAGVTVLVLAVIMVPTAIGTVTQRSMPDRILGHVESVVRPGDVVAIHSAGRLFELAWSTSVRGDEATQPVAVVGLAQTAGYHVGPTGVSTGRTWLLDWSPQHKLGLDGVSRCARDWSVAGARVSCLSSLR